MRTNWMVLAGLAFLLSVGPGCSSSGGTTGSSTSASGSSGGGSTTGTTGGSSSGGTTGGGKAAGAPCAGNAECTSALCGVNDSNNGHCCAAACSHVTAPCGAADCTSTGACAYPTGTTACGATCTGATLNPSACDGAGACVPGRSAPCPNHLACNGTAACYAQCSSGTAECAAGFYCASGACVAQKAAGQPCTSDVSCALGICGVNGTGNCCVAKCDTTDPLCGATGCDGQGLCTFPTLQCRASSCTGATLTQATSCNGAGICPAVATTTDCSPFACTGSPAACTTSCSPASAASDCASGGFCDPGFQVCCPGLASGNTIKVDGTTGSDAATCCGIGTNQACQTLTRAMVLVDAAQAKNVTIAATVNGGGGDWALAETYPVLLGWGVELSAPGVFFVEAPPSALPMELFDVGTYSASDTVGYASIAGSAQSPVGVGMDSTNNQTSADATIRVETGATLYLANASVNGSTNGNNYSTLAVSFEATLVLGQDQSGNVTGTVVIGNALGAKETNGNLGIYCQGCTVKDAALGGQSSVVIQGQRLIDIKAEEPSTITLSSNPVLGVPPRRAGFNRCPQKDDGMGYGTAVRIQGNSTVTFNNGVVQCIDGAGFELWDVGLANGTPTLNIDNSIIQNTELGIWGQGGTATATNTMIRYNVIGVEQVTDSDGITGAVDLSGGGNTVACSSNVESIRSYTFPGIDVYNASTQTLNASNVSWDTANPDYFDCDANFNCVCNLGSCATAPGDDDMDAVEDATNGGGITLTGAGQAAGGCN